MNKIITKEEAWKVYNFVNDWKAGKFGEVDLQCAINNHYDKKQKVCCICGKEFDGWGNNPWPIVEDGECCDECNMTRVVPARIEMTMK